MPKVNKKRKKRNKYPKGYVLVKDTLIKFKKKLKEITLNQSSNTKKNLHKIIQVSNQRSRYIYTMYYKDKKINREVYDYCLQHHSIDVNLIAKWKRDGYEFLCCLQCIQHENTTNGTVCICRVPPEQRREDIFQCTSCGCTGCTR